MKNRYTIIIHYLECILEINDHEKTLDDKFTELVAHSIVLFCAIAPVATILKFNVYDVYVKPLLNSFLSTFFNL